MNLILKLCYLFFIGSLFGWVLELFYRRFFSKMNPERKWINPGFCVGPYVPLYGCGLVVLYLLSSLNTTFWNDSLGGSIATVLIMGVGMTLLEYLTGVFCLKFLKVRLWNYKNEWANLQGLICPKFSVYWTLLAGAFYLLIYPHILNAIDWLSRNMAFCFVIGFFFGVFSIDFTYSARLITKMKKFAEEHDVIVRYEQLKAEIREFHDHLEQNPRLRFVLAFRSELSLAEHMKNAYEKLQERLEKQLDESLETIGSMHTELGNLHDAIELSDSYTNDKLDDLHDAIELRRRKH